MIERNLYLRRSHAVTTGKAIIASRTRHESSTGKDGQDYLPEPIEKEDQHG